jgi:acyl-CoA thioester hydrolase
MADFKFTCSVQVRYADLDAQGHVNNAAYFTYMEQARFEYMAAAGLWQPGQDFLSVGTIVAEATCAYKRPILLGQAVQVAVRVAQIGNKSGILEYRLTADGEEAATGRTVQVAYDYATGKSIPVPDEWRARVRAFEGNPDL